MVDYRAIITLEPGKRSGKPCIRGLRIAVQDVLGWMAGGMTLDAILADYPELTRDDVLACLGYAADRERHGAMLRCRMKSPLEKNRSRESSICMIARPDPES